MSQGALTRSFRVAQLDLAQRSLAITLLAASGVAATIGFLLPWLFARFGNDPAFGAGPMATVIQDVLSLLIYFIIAAALAF